MPLLDSAHCLEVATVDAAVSSTFFWSYILMLQTLARTLATLVSWVDGCTCHWFVLQALREGAGEGVDTLADAAATMQARHAWERCPLRGRRLPELAAGDFVHDLGELFAQRGVHLVQSLALDLTDPQRLSIIKDFERGRSHLAFTLAAKLTHWQSPPWCAFALAHPDPAKAAAAYEKVRDAGVEPDTHPLCREILSGALHSQFEVWFSDYGCCFSDVGPGEGELPLVRAKLAELRLAPSSDRMVEALHAESSKVIKRAPNHKEAYVSLCHRCEDLFSEMDTNPAVLSQLASVMAPLGSPKTMVECLGLAGHPSCSQTSGSRDGLFQQIIYSNDPHSKYSWAPQCLVRGRRLCRQSQVTRCCLRRDHV